MDTQTRRQQMIQDETASMIKGINFCLKHAKFLLVIGIVAFIAGGVVGAHSIDARKILMTVSAFTFAALGLSGTTALKLSSSLLEGGYREMTRDLSWRWKPWSSIGLGIILTFASVGYSV